MAPRLAACALLSIATVLAADKEKPPFKPGPASSYPAHQTIEKITIAAAPFITDEQASTAFGKVNPYTHGILPVLVVLENGTGKALSLDLQAEYVDPDRQHLDAVPPGDVPRLQGAKKPSIPGTSRNPLPHRAPKSPLDIWEIPGRAFAVKMAPIGETVSGFFYFQTTHRTGSKLYLTGIKDAATGKDYFYFEIPLDKQ
jgi:hypothetical protein